MVFKAGSLLVEKSGLPFASHPLYRQSSANENITKLWIGTYARYPNAYQLHNMLSILCNPHAERLGRHNLFKWINQVILTVTWWSTRVDSLLREVLLFTSFEPSEMFQSYWFIRSSIHYYLTCLMVSDSIYFYTISDVPRYLRQNH